jgi:hypothetical protein
MNVKYATMVHNELNNRHVEEEAILQEIEQEENDIYINQLVSKNGFIEFNLYN